MSTNTCSTYFTYSSMFENCFSCIFIYIYKIPLKCRNIACPYGLFPAARVKNPNAHMVTTLITTYRIFKCCCENRSYPTCSLSTNNRSHHYLCRNQLSTYHDLTWLSCTSYCQILRGNIVWIEARWRLRPRTPVQNFRPLS
jgi:hypothetical protein